MCSPQASNAPSASSSSTRSAWIFLNKSSAPRSRQATRLRLAESHCSRCARYISAAIENFVLLMFVSLDKTGRDCGVDCLYKILVQNLLAVQDDIAALRPQILALFFVVLPGELKQLWRALRTLGLADRRHRVRNWRSVHFTLEVQAHKIAELHVIHGASAALCRGVHFSPFAHSFPSQLRRAKHFSVPVPGPRVDLRFVERNRSLEVLWLDLARLDQQSEGYRQIVRADLEAACHTNCGVQDQIGMIVSLFLSAVVLKVVL